MAKRHKRADHTPFSAQSGSQTPTDLQDLFDRVIFLIRTIVGSTIGVIIIGALALIALLVVSILRGFAV